MITLAGRRRHPGVDRGYAVGFPDGREFSRDLGERSYRVSDRPRVSVAPGEIMGVVSGPLSAAG